ncbi:MAG: cellulase family glycosylhydrolase [Ruminococcus sp.]|nr:cellulase family glycosylhydrolase [Ruminococcus sp.]
MSNKNKGFRRIISISAAAVCMMSALNFAPLNDNMTVDAADVMTAFEITQDMKIGWNYGNSLDASGKLYKDNPERNIFSTGNEGLDVEMSWNNPRCTQETMDAVKAKGFNTVRLPTTWTPHMDENNKIDADWMARVHEVVDYCYKNDMYVILNIHHEEWINRPDFDTAYEEISVKLKAVWKQIAEEFKDYDQHLIFEGMNEPRAAGQEYEWWLAPSAPKEKLFEVINKLNQDFVDTVRSVESPYQKTRLLSCPPYCASGSDINMMSALELPDDPYVAASVHAYSPYNFCMGDGEHNTFSETYATELEGILKNIRKTFIDNNIPVILGEFSASNYNNTEARCEWATTYISLAKSYGFPCVLWDNDARGNSDQSEAHDYLNRVTNTWYEDSGQVIDAMMAVHADDSIVWGASDFTTQKQYKHDDISTGKEIANTAGAYDSNVDGKEGSPAQIIKFSEFDGKEIAVKYTGGDPELAFMDSDWGGWTTVKPYYIDEKNGIAYFSSDDIKTAWEANNGNVSSLNSVIIRANGKTTVEKAVIMNKGTLVDTPDKPKPETTTTTSSQGGNTTTTTTTTTTEIPDDFKFEVVKLPVKLNGEKTLKFTIEGSPSASVGGGICYDAGEWASVEWSGNVGANGKLEMTVDISDIPSSVKDAEIQIWWSNVWDSKTETGIDQPAKVTVDSSSESTKPDGKVSYGDVDEDGSVGINDCVLIMQSMANPDKYTLSEQGRKNADVVDGDGVTNSDALAIQFVESRTITTDIFPITSVQLDALSK